MKNSKKFKLSLLSIVAITLLSLNGAFAQVQLAHFQTDVQPEDCVICHEQAGVKHQEVYDSYTDQSAFKVTIDSVASVDNGVGTYDVTMMFTIKKNGQPYIDVNGLPSLDQMRVYTVTYDSTTEMFDNDHRLSNGGSGVIALGGGQYSVTSTMDYAPELSNAEVYLYIAQGKLDTEGMTLYDNVYNAGKKFGDVDTYESAANVSGCEKCHGTPYYKHGYRAAKVSGLPDFAACKTCHYDTKTGGHEDWQILVDNPARYAEIYYNNEDLTPAEETKYAYTANVMNDVHMSHAMEFPYPQSMSNCVTCHEGKLDVILADDNFKFKTCKSCHPVDGPEEGTEANRAPALKSVMPQWIHGSMTLDAVDCEICHSEASHTGLPRFSDIHSGYDKHIYTTEGSRYSDEVVVTIDSASFDNNNLTIQFSASIDPNLNGFDVNDIKPTVLVGLYGYDTKDFIVSPHSRDEDKNRLLEFAVDGVTTNPRFTVIKAENGSWEVIADLSMWADMITDGTVKRAEIAILPLLADIVGEIDSHENGETDDTAYALNAPSRTFDLIANAFDDGFYSAIVKVTDGCNTCHDALATTFHSPDRGGNIVVCRLCHVTTSGGSHLEMQSRSIDSYVHAIHSFQAFDIGDVNFTDPVEALRYDLHIEHVYPNFTIKNCESCHNKGTYNVPDQSKSLPGLLSGSDYPLMGWDRNIGEVPAYITGPAARACGSCHRADMIKEDNAGELISFFSHTQRGGYLIENGADEAPTLDEVIEDIMKYFK